MLYNMEHNDNNSNNISETIKSELMRDVFVKHHDLVFKILHNQITEKYIKKYAMQYGGGKNINEMKDGIYSIIKLVNEMKNK